ncbi:hypothetical protein [[Clostridium] polysaccharolyticum]|uniref:Uncharacterized protein n=1 Tax=[Clostridium] polysaccharolyticum TaxID=29364 RepID=A0A1I0BV61_9FIRM|nr:hypothetical protein [[Clostridium] polysaccharolyticum]SET10950.1 hypothetical protein SAMN04487772_108110 [[Clostridium] polysaccharolyticum]
MKNMKSVFYGIVVSFIGILFVKFMDSTFVGNVLYFNDEAAGIIVFAVIYLAGVIAACTVRMLSEKR